jgi:hypothetical protein
MDFIMPNNPRMVPMMMCNVCNQPIEKMAEGLVAWKYIEEGKDPEYLDEEEDELDQEVRAVFETPWLISVHKGRCFREFETGPSAVGDIILTMELTQCLEAWLASPQFRSYDRRLARLQLERERRIG